MRKWDRRFNRKIAKVVARGMALLGAAVTIVLEAEPTFAAADFIAGYQVELNNYHEGLGESSISISIGGGNSEILSADKGIAQGMIKQTANVEFGATNGYTVKISGTPNLTGANTKATIPSAALTLGNMVNQWGWYAVDGAADCSETNVYKAMTSDGAQIDSGVLADGGTKTYTMCFGMRVNGNQAADTYNGSVTVSVVAEPGMIRTAPFSGITYMQDMTANICKLADENETAQLIDRRDNKKYWVTKLLDGNCWMSQNLALDLSTNKALTSADSDVASSWTPGQNTIQNVPTGGVSSSTETYSWNLGSYVIINPTATTACSSNNTGLSACAGQFVAVGSRTPSTDPNFYKNHYGSTRTYTDTEYDAHYLAGNYYQWNAATAGTGGTITNANASGSICPKNWKLPNSNSTAKNSFYYLLQQYGVESALSGSFLRDVLGGTYIVEYNVAEGPLFFVRGGHVNPNYSSTPFGYAGQEGYYWSSQAHSSTANYAYYFCFNDSSVVPSASNGYRFYGRSLRCLVPTT